MLSPNPDPYEQMRGVIIDVKTYNLAEQAGMFCESLREALGQDKSPFRDTEFFSTSDEPYELLFIWDSDDLRIKLCFMADPDNSTWSVSKGKKRFKGEIGKDRDTSARIFIDTVNKIRSSTD